MLAWLGFKSDNTRHGPGQFSIILAKSGGSSRFINLEVIHVRRFFVLFCLLLSLLISGFGYSFYHHAAISDEMVQLEETKEKITDASKKIELSSIEQKKQQLHEQKNRLAYRQLAQRMQSLEAKLLRINQRNAAKVSAVANLSNKKAKQLTGVGGATAHLTDKALQDWLLNYGNRQLNRLQTELANAAAVPSGYPVDMSNTRITSQFGLRTNPFTNQGSEFHNGLDFAAETGTEIYAAADGVVIDAGAMGGLGNAVKIDHGHDYNTAYGHMSKVLVETGAKVKAGDLIGLVGSTGRSSGSHLHYIVYFKGQAIDPLPYV